MKASTRVVKKKKANKPTSTTPWVNFEQVKRLGNFQIMLDHYQITGQKTDDEIRIHCPFHEDDHPSCGVNVMENKFHCFACETGGNILEFVTLMENGDPDRPDDLRNGALTIMKRCGFETPRAAKMPAKIKNRSSGGKLRKLVKDADTGDSGAPDTGCEEKPNAPLGFELTLTPEHAFFEKREMGIHQIETFGLGYYEGRGTMNGRICIPIHNENGELIAYAGRWATEPIPDDNQKYKLPDGFRKSFVLYNLNRILEQNPKHVVIVEGFWSVQRLHLLGIPAVAMLGTSVSEQQITLLEESSVKAVTVLLDGDDAGRNGAERSALLLARAFYVRVVDLPEGIKPDTMSDDFIASVQSG